MVPQLFSDGTTSIYHGDCLEALRMLPDESVQLIFADPPYNIGKTFGTFVDRWPSDGAYAEWCYEWLTLCLAKLSATGSMYLMSSTQAMPYLDVWLRERCTILSRIVWHYDSSGVQARRFYGSLYEPILFCVKNPKQYTFHADAIQIEAKTGATRKLVDYRKPVPAPYPSKKVPGNVWYFPRVRYRMPEYENHPSQKPEALLSRMILASSHPSDTILDPFAGTFTTAAVAQKHNRKSISIEQNVEYVKIGLRRLKLAEHLDGLPLTPSPKSFKRRPRSPKP